ncbi:MAG: hypothetical protein WBC51_05025 [Vicinamibacterales bacterium]
MRPAATDGKAQRLETRLNHFIESIVRRALVLNARDAELARRHDLRQQEAKRRTDANNRTYIEAGRHDHFDKLVDYWVRARERRAFLARLREVAGEVTPESEIGCWLAWAEGFARAPDPLARFSERGKTLKVYYYDPGFGLVAKRIEGFTDPHPTPDQKRGALIGITLTSAPPDNFEHAIEFELALDDILPYETTEPGWVPRLFVVPARVLNAALVIGSTKSDAGGAAVVGA